MKMMGEAVEWVKRTPSDPNAPDEEVDTAHFAPSDPASELRAAEHRLREQVEARAK